MKAILVFVFLTSLHFMPVAQPTPGEQVAYTIAKKLRDSLSLTEAQRQQIFIVNMTLHQQNQQARQQYTNFDTLTFHLQKVENSRDTLYHNILLSTQYQLYQQKRGTLISTN